MQKEFNKLNETKKRKFLVKNITKDNSFFYIHKKINILYPEYIYKKKEHIELIKKRNDYIYLKICKYISNYRDYVIDIYNDENNKYFYEQIIKYKHKLLHIINIDNLYLQDENDFYIIDLLIDVIKNTKDIIKNEHIKLNELNEMMNQFHIIKH
jgi:hypothetical protein